MEVIAHRGASTEALENSFSAFTKAIEAGATRIELDAHLSADGMIVIIHDEDFKRTADSKLLIKDVRLSTFREIRLINGEQVPLLSQVIERFLPNIELNIELKSGGTDLVDAVLKALPPTKNRKNKVIISSFDLELLKYLASLNTSETIALLWEKDENSLLVESMTSCDSKVLHPEARKLDQGLMDIARENQWLVYPYISLENEVDKESLWHKLKSLGINGFCTNYPRELSKWLKDPKND